MCHQLLASPAFAADQNGNFKRRDLDDLSTKPLDRGAFTDQTVEPVASRLQCFGLALVELEFAFERFDALTQSVDLGGSLEHDPSDGAKDIAIPLNRDARHHALGPSHPLDLADFRFSGRHDVVQLCVVDDPLDRSPVALARLQAEESFVNG